MACPYPLPPFFHTQYCFLPPIDEHNTIMQSLSRSVLLKPISFVYLLPPHQLAALPPVTEGMLLKLPNWLIPGQLENDADYWENNHYFHTLSCQTIEDTYDLPPKIKALVTNRDFPINFWHPDYFHQATVAMGVMAGIISENLKDEQGPYVQLLIHCYDANHIPYLLIVGLDPPPPSPPPDDPPSPHPPDHHDQIPNDNPPAYMQPWRRRGIDQVPAASETPIQPWSTELTIEPDPWKILTAVSNPQECKNACNNSKYLATWKLLHNFHNKWPRHISKNIQNPPKVSATVVKDFNKAYPKLPGDSYQRIIKSIKQQKIFSHLLTLTLYSISCSPNSCSSQYTSLSTDNTIKHPSNLFSPCKTNINLNSPTQRTFVSNTMAALTKEDEALIQKFIDLKTDDHHNSVIQLPQESAIAIDWDRCLLARVITQRTVLDASFSNWMIKAWGSDPGTQFKPVSKACYLVEFTSTDEMERVQMAAGSWAFRGDIVATRKVTSHLDLNRDHIMYADLWVQLYNIPISSVNGDGLELIGASLGTPVSLPTEGFSGGRRFVKLKIKVDIRQPVKDFAKFKHPTLGEFRVYPFYERASHICRFCGLLGHIMGACPDHIRLMEIATNPNHSERLNRKDLMEPRLGPWIMDSSVIPKEIGMASFQERKRPITYKSRQEGTWRQPQATPIRSSDENTISKSTSISLKRPRPAGPNAPVVDI